jgi:hypothetical protein
VRVANGNSFVLHLRSDFVALFCSDIVAHVHVRVSECVNGVECVSEGVCV